MRDIGIEDGGKPQHLDRTDQFGKKTQGARREFQDRGFVPVFAVEANVQNYLDVVSVGMVERGDKALMGNAGHFGFGFAGGVWYFLVFPWRFTLWLAATL